MASNRGAAEIVAVMVVIQFASMPVHSVSLHRSHSGLRYMAGGEMFVKV